MAGPRGSQNDLAVRAARLIPAERIRPVFRHHIAMAKAIQFDQKIGGPENLKLRDTSFPEPDEVEVELRVHAVGLNRAESMYRRGLYYVFERLEDGRFHPKIAKIFPLEHAVEAYQYLESNEQLGKIVIS